MVLPKGGLPPALVLGHCWLPTGLAHTGFWKQLGSEDGLYRTVSKVQEDNITFLKTAVLVKEVYGKDKVTLEPLTKGAIIVAPDKLNSASSKKILGAFPCTRVQTANCAEIADRQLFPYCENPALSLQDPGVKYNALSIPADTPESNDIDRQQLFDCLNCSYLFDANKPASAGALRNVWQDIVNNQAAHRHVHLVSV